jgi:D-beta-D-heptose 7-phosphate kinase/D-beta-D-heptose 1-phosphate adenosyltransferase
MNRKRIHNILSEAFAKRILVIGDVMLDEFVWGKVSRISPEAPVPVVEVSHESSYPGGAANVARNLAEFTGSVRVLGMVGRDSFGAQLRGLLAEERIRTDCLVESAAVPTIVKTRIIARQQQVVRVDREKKIKPDAEALRAILAQVERVLPETDAIIFEDYGKGLLVQALKDEVCKMVNGRGIVVTVDPNPGNPLDWAGVTAIKPNRSEAFAAAGVPMGDPADDPLQDEPLLEVGRRLIERWQAKQLLITLSEHGMILFEDGQPPYHTPTRAQEVFDVSGAGDTAISLYTLALAAGATARESAEIANHASGIVVGKLGTATVSAAELLESFPE